MAEQMAYDLIEAQDAKRAKKKAKTAATLERLAVEGLPKRGHRRR